MDKTSQKVIEQGKKSYVTPHLPYLPLYVTPHLPYLPLRVTPQLLHPPMPQDQMILMPMVLVYLWSLPSVLVYFLHITLFSLKDSAMIAWWLTMRKKNFQKDVISFRKIYAVNE